MDAINISLIITIIIYLFLALILLFKAKNNIIRSSYFLMIFAVVLWTLGMILYRNASPERSVFWCTFLYIMATFTSSTFLYFSIIFPYQEKVKPIVKFLIILLNLLIIIAVLIPEFIIRGVKIPNTGEKIILWGQGYPLYVVYIAGLFSIGFLILFKKYRFAKGLIKDQLRYVFWGDFFSANLAMITNLILVWFSNFKFNWLGQNMSVIMVIATVYAIIRYRFMDIRIVARKIFIYIGLAAFAYGIFYLIAWIYTKSFGGVFTTAGYFAGVFIAPAFVVAFYWLNKALQYIANKYFFFSLYNYEETINKLSQELNYYNDLNQIVNAIVDTIKRIMQLDRAGVLLINSKEASQSIHYQVAKVIGFNEENGISLVQDDSLTRHLQKTQKPLVKDELILIARDSRDIKEKEGLEKLHNNMERIEASLCLPLMSSNQLIGIIVLGAKISGDAYTKEDLELLNTLAYQAGIAIDNARLYKEVQDFNKTLQQKVDEQTKDIQMKANHLEKLLKMRSEFLDIASHQLRTPVSVIKGVVSMMAEGDLDKMPKEKQKEFIHSVFEKSKKLEQIIHDILQASELDTKKYEITPATPKVQLEEVLDEVVKRFSFEAKQRQIDLVWRKPKTALPAIIGEARYLEEAFANLVDNALKYTPSTGKVSGARGRRDIPGQIKIFLKQEGKNLIVKIRDNGIGIPQEELGRLFQKFVRAKNATEMYTDGSGLGLFIVKEIIEGHHGKVWVESVINKGTTFYVSLPVVK